MSDPRLETIESFEVAGLMVRTSNEQENDPDTSQVSAVWNEFFDSGTYDHLRQEDENPPLHGVYSDYEDDSDGPWTLTVGVAASEDIADDAGAATVVVAAGEYLVWEAEGDLEDIQPETWADIADYFDDNPPYVRAYGTDFERFIDGTRLEVFVGVNPA